MAISGNTWTFDTLILKNKTVAQWTSANPTLAKGEIGLENDTGKFKLGDGTKNWTSLSYATMTVAEIDTELAKKANTSAIPAVVDNLTSTSTTSALSANQGKTLKELIDEIKAVTTIAVA